MANWIFQSAQNVVNTHVKLEFRSDTSPHNKMSLHLPIESAKKLATEVMKATGQTAPTEG